MVLVLCLCSTGMAQTWHTANQATIAWTAVAPVAPTDVIKYQLYTRTDTVSAGTKVGTEVTGTQSLVTFSTEGRYYIGVETIRYPVGETVGIRAAKSWSNIAADCAAAGPFGIVFFVAPPAATGLRNVP
jgi:heme/copper-type cytochrome/quinol oxidase subunit 2